MQPGEQPVDDPHPALRGHHEIRPALRRPYHPVGPDRRLHGPYSRRADRDDPAVPGPRRVDQPRRGRRGTANRSGYGGSCASADATPVCSMTGANCTPRLTSSATSRAVKGRAALGISALPAPSADGSANTV